MDTKRAVTLCVVMLCSLGSAVAQTEWVQHPGNPVIDAHAEVTGVWASAVVFDGTTYHMWFREPFVWCIPFGASIGHATSNDGVVWTLDPANPVMEVESFEGFATEVFFPGAVLFDGSLFHMWYSVDREHESGVNIQYATSTDGTHWTEYVGNPVMENGPPGSWDDGYLVPTAVLVEDGTFKMWFVGSHTDVFPVGGKVGYAESADGITWTKRPDPVLSAGGSPEAGWETGIYYPFVLYDGSVYHMWYTGGYPATRYFAHPDGSGATKLGYAYSFDGISWTKFAGNPIAEAGDHFIAQPIVLAVGPTFKMWYSHSPDNCTWEVRHATSGRTSAASQFIPAAVWASGAKDSFYRTDVDLNNADDRPVTYWLHWLPRGQANSDPVTSGTYTLGPGQSVRYANVLSAVFGLEPNAVGALAVVSSSPHLLAASRISARAAGEDGGTFGQVMPAVSLDDLIQSNQRRRILFASENEDLRFNVGCQNGSDRPVTVNLELFNSEGTFLERKRMLLPAFGNDQLSRVFEDYVPVSGYVDVWSDTDGALFYCYGSVVDNLTNDPMTVLPQ